MNFTGLFRKAQTMTGHQRCCIYTANLATIHRDLVQICRIVRSLF
jgi:hypothetical protein